MELVTVSHCAKTILNVITGAIGMKKVENIGKHCIQLFFDKNVVLGANVNYISIVM